MASKRLTVGKDGILRNREGEAVARLVSMTVELIEADAVGDMGAAVRGEQLGLSPNALDAPASAGNSGSGTGAKPKFDPVLEVWQHYVAVMKPRSAGLDPQQRATIREALKVGTLTELKRCIDGCAASDFHMGKNDRRKKYNSLTQILKAKRGGRTVREQIDFFLDLAEKSGVQSGVPSAERGRLSSAKRDVLDALDFPSDERVQDRGRESEGWLRQQGITFDRQNRRFLTVDGPTDD